MANLTPDDLVAVRGFRVIAVAPEGDKVLVRYEIPADKERRAGIITHFWAAADDVAAPAVL